MKFFDCNGVELSLLEWADRMADDGYRHVAHTRVISDLDSAVYVEVRTAWFGHDLSLIPGSGPPLTFETVVHHWSTGGVQFDRWANEQDAERGHAEIVAYLLAETVACHAVHLDAEGRPIRKDQ